MIPGAAFSAATDTAFFNQTKLSLGYARVWGGGLNSGELMISLKLL